MGLLNGTMSLRYYRVEGDLPKEHREEFVAQAKRFAFRELAPEKEYSIGWVQPENFLDVDFRDDTLFRNQYLACTLRIDQKKVDARLFRALFDREHEKLKKETNRERVKPFERKEIKERIQRKLLAEAVPTRRLYDVCWDVPAGRMYFFATGDKLQDVFREQFEKCFHMAANALTVKGRFEAVTGETMPPDLEDPGREFLQWLYWRTDQEGGKFTLPRSGEIALWIEDRMFFKEPGEADPKPGTPRPASTTLAGGDPARAPEARASLAGGKRLTKVKLGLKRGEREWSFVLDGETLDVTALKIPALFTEEEDEKLFERLALLEEASFVVEELFGEYAKARLSDDWERKDQAWQQRWIQEGAPAVAGGGARKVAAEAPAARAARKPKARARAAATPSKPRAAAKTARRR